MDGFHKLQRVNNLTVRMKRDISVMVEIPTKW